MLLMTFNKDVLKLMEQSDLGVEIQLDSQSKSSTKLVFPGRLEDQLYFFTIVFEKGEAQLKNL